MLSEESFANHTLDMKDENDDYTISDFLSQHFGITIGEKLNVLLVMQKNPPTYLTTCHQCNHWNKYQTKEKK